MSQLATLGKYHILERLAADEVAEIYKVKTLGIAGFEKVQVLKRIMPPFGRDPSFMRTFIEEAKIAFSLNHRNIVQVFEFGKADGDLFLAMEYIPGVNLLRVAGRLHQRRQTMPIGLACYLMGEVAGGLEYAHRKLDHFGQELHIVHCDISPRNVACSFEGSVKVLDFGISRAVWSVLPQQVLATSRYLSPEQVRSEPLDPRSDLFSFGVILWELLAGRPLFTAPTPEEVLDNILVSPIPHLQQINPEVPPRLADLIMNCLDREPARRIANTNDLQVELQRIQRTLGAVIGSRSLCAYLEQLFPNHGDYRDVRQEEEAAPGALPEEPAQARRSLDLLEAAAELAERPNPPPQPVLDSTNRQQEKPRYHEEASTADGQLPAHRGATPVNPVFSQQGSHLAQSTGGLRSLRHLGQEAEGQIGRQGSLTYQPGSGIGRISSEELTGGPNLVNDRLRFPFDSEAHDELSTPSIPQISPLAELSSLSLPSLAINEDDDEEGDANASTTGAEARPELPGADGPLPESDFQSTTDLRALPRSLGEKKRFIAATALLEGSPAACREAASLMADIGYKLDGILHTHHEGELVLLFGLPTADENDIVAAARFALDAQEAVANLRVGGTAERDLRGANPDPVELRVGIRAGTARLQGHPSSAAYQLLGNSLEEGEALAWHAAPGQILVSGAAVPLASQHYLLRDAPPLQRHGKRISCRRLLHPRPRSRRRKGAPAGPFLGREVELRALRNAWRETVMRGGQYTMLIAGEPGVGKSRLADEFLAANAADARIIAVAATPHRWGIANAILVDLLRAVTGTWSASGGRTRERMLSHLRQLLGQEEQTLETIEYLLRPSADVQDSREIFSRRRIARAFRLLLNRLAENRPTVVVVEDLHWADSSSFECLRALVEQQEPAQGPLLFLLTQRPEEGVTPQNRFCSDTCSFMLLEELDESERQRLIIETLGGEATNELMGEVERRAGGNPLYIHELARALKELATNQPSEVPATIQGLLSARVDRLHPQVKAVLQHAAIIGSSFREGILAKLLGRNPARELAILRNHGIIAPGLRTAATSETLSGLSEHFEREWIFCHLLIQEVVYAALSGAARRKLHQRVSEIVIRRVERGLNDPPAEIARHLELAGHASQASEYYLRAANAAATSFASREALALYDKALRAHEGPALQRYLIHAGKEWVYAQLGRHQEQAVELEAMRALSDNDPGRLADLRNREAVRLLRLGEFYRALAAAEEAEQAANRCQAALARGEALRLRGEAYERLMDHPRAIDATSKALEIFVEQQAVPEQIRARIGLGRLALVQAKYDEAFEHYTPALELIKQTGDRWQERILRNNLAIVHYCRGDFSKALDEALYSHKICERFGDRAREGDNAAVAGIIYLEFGVFELARQYLEEALAIHQETESRWSEAETKIYLALLEVASRRFHSALRHLEQARAIADQMGAKYIGIAARNALAHTLCERGTPEDAARALEEAASASEMARNTRLIVGEIPGLCRSARATARLGELEAARGLSRRAVELLNEQRIIESPEEEIYYTHYRILRAMNDPAADGFLELAHTGFMSKLARIETAELRESFSEAVQLNAAIRRDYLNRG